MTSLITSHGKDRGLTRYGPANSIVVRRSSRFLEGCHGEKTPTPGGNKAAGTRACPGDV
ncbi:MAG: hypothetical protein ACJ8BW_29930 [Ktedonobacteraceae bacterium]